MSRFEIAERLAHRAVSSGPSDAADGRDPTLLPVAVDRDGEVAAALLARISDDGHPVRAWIFAFEWENESWLYLFDHDDEWLGETLDRPSGPPALRMTTSVSGDATTSGRPVLAFAGVASTAAHDAVCTTPDGAHSVPIDPATGGFVLVAHGPSVELTLRDSGGEIVDRLEYSAPPPVSW